MRRLKTKTNNKNILHIVKIENEKGIPLLHVTMKFSLGFTQVLSFMNYYIHVRASMAAVLNYTAEAFCSCL